MSHANTSATQQPRVLTGYDYRDGELHAWYQLAGGPRRWVDNDHLVTGEILKGNADLVGQGAWERDFEVRR